MNYRSLSAILALLWIPAALADGGHLEFARSATHSEPCWTSSETSAKSAPVFWSVQIRRHTAIYVIGHVHNACRIIEHIADSRSAGAEPELNSILDNLRNEVLVPIYRVHPSLARVSLPSDSASKGVLPKARSSREDISRMTAVRLELALARIRQQLFQVASKSVNQSSSKESADALLQPFVDAAAELGFASKVAFDAYPDLWAKQLRSVPNQPRSSDSDADFRKSAPPLGSVRLSAAALTEVRAFMRQLRRDLPRDEWIASLSWVTDRRSKDPSDSDWIRSGAGLVLGSYRRTEVPPDIIDKVDGVEIIFTAPDPSILVGKTIDLQKGQLVIGD